MGFPDESEYQGGTTSGELIHGIFAFSNHEVYDGEWRDDAPHGAGEHSALSGERYVGEWIGGARHGKGTFFSALGHKYEGDWVGGALRAAQESQLELRAKVRRKRVAKAQQWRHV